VFLMAKGHWKNFLQNFGFLCQLSFHHCYIFIYLSLEGRAVVQLEATVPLQHKLTLIREKM
jgi:hypothetical protein